jgi:hypothetical protein
VVAKLAGVRFCESLPERLDEVVRIGKEYLETLLQPIYPDYECIAFRAANWSMSPSRNVIRALLKNGIRVDTSVFKHGCRKGIVSFDYSNANSDLVPWMVAEEDICRSDAAGKLMEVPIYCERRWLGAFLSMNRFYRAKQSQKHRLKNVGNTQSSGLKKESKARRILNALGMAFRCHPWKADFNQCSGRQLIKAIERAEARHGDSTMDLPFVLIGHSKLFTRRNEQSLRPFLEFIATHPTRFCFGTFDEVLFEEPCQSQVPHSERVH